LSFVVLTKTLPALRELSLASLKYPVGRFVQLTFIKFLRSSRPWGMSVPVKIFYESHDWAKESDKLETQNLLKLDKFETINESNHFSFLENTTEVSELIKR